MQLGDSIKERMERSYKLSITAIPTSTPRSTSEPPRDFT